MKKNRFVSGHRAAFHDGRRLRPRTGLGHPRERAGNPCGQWPRRVAARISSGSATAMRACGRRRPARSSRRVRAIMSTSSSCRRRRGGHGPLAEDLIDFVLARALPGMTVTISDYEAVPVDIAVTALRRYRSLREDRRAWTASLARSPTRSRWSGAASASRSTSPRSLPPPRQVEGVSKPSRSTLRAQDRRARAAPRSDRDPARSPRSSRARTRSSIRSRKRRRRRRDDGGSVMTAISDIKTRAGRLLYRQLPGRVPLPRPARNDEEPGDLEAYLHGFGHLLDLIRGTTEQAYADAFADAIDFPDRSRRRQPGDPDVAPALSRRARRRRTACPRPRRPRR